MNQQERDTYLSFNPVGEGWMPIVRNLDKQLSAIDPYYTIEQVKEKFGGLRFYFTTDLNERHEEMFDFVWAGERLSFRTCENCGSTENVRTQNLRYWKKTLCKKCEELP
jgi:hypothetical protein